MSGASLSTPNQSEAAQLFGPGHAGPTRPHLITGSDASAAQQQTQIEHRLCGIEREQRWHVPRRPGSYRGSGCLLASAITAYLVAGQDLAAACEAALRCVDTFLANAHQYPDGIHIPQAPL